MDAYFTTLGTPDRRWTGKLQQILPTPEVVNNVVLYTALFDVANPKGQLMTQMTAQVFFVQAAGAQCRDAARDARSALARARSASGARVTVVSDSGADEPARRAGRRLQPRHGRDHLGARARARACVVGHESRNRCDAVVPARSACGGRAARAAASGACVASDERVCAFP